MDAPCVSCKHFESSVHVFPCNRCTDNTGFDLYEIDYDKEEVTMSTIPDLKIYESTIIEEKDKKMNSILNYLKPPPSVIPDDTMTLGFTLESWVKLMSFVQAVSTEIAGMGRVVNGICTDIKLYKQEVTGATADNRTAADFHEFLLRDEVLDNASEWCLQWHSHVNMSPSPSGTDKTNLEELLTVGYRHGLYSMIINKSEQYTCSFNVPIKYHLKAVPCEGYKLSPEEIEEYSSIEVDVIKHNVIIQKPNTATEEIDIDIIYDCLAEIEANVFTKSHAVTTYGGFNYGYQAQANGTDVYGRPYDYSDNVYLGR